MTPHEGSPRSLTAPHPAAPTPPTALHPLAADASGRRSAPLCGAAARSVPSSAEDSPSGLGRTLGKRVGGNPSRVRISHPPPPHPPAGSSHGLIASAHVHAQQRASAAAGCRRCCERSRGRATAAADRAACLNGAGLDDLLGRRLLLARRPWPCRTACLPDGVLPGLAPSASGSGGLAQLGGQALVRRVAVDRARRTSRPAVTPARSRSARQGPAGAISDCGARSRVHATGVGAPRSESTVMTASPMPSWVSTSSRSYGEFGNVEAVALSALASSGVKARSACCTRLPSWARTSPGTSFGVWVTKKTPTPLDRISRTVWAIASRNVLRRVVEEQVRLVEEEHQLGLVDVADLGQVVEEVRQQPHEERREQPRPVLQLRQLQQRDDPACRRRRRASGRRCRTPAPRRTRRRPGPRRRSARAGSPPPWPATARRAP